MTPMLSQHAPVSPGISKKNINVKLQKIGDIQPSLPFTEYDFLKKYYCCPIKLR